MKFQNSSVHVSKNMRGRKRKRAKMLKSEKGHSLDKYL